MYSPDNFKLSIVNEKDVTQQDILNEADQIWRKVSAYVKANNLEITNIDESEKLLGEMRTQHKEFAQSYPIVLRYMCEMQEYDTRALRLYLLKIKEHPWKSISEYLDSQADYVVLLYKAKHPRYNKNDVLRLKTNIRNKLQQEHDVFEEKSKAAAKEVEEQEARFKRLNENTMEAFYKMHKEDALNVPIRINTDIPTTNCVTLSAPELPKLGMKLTANDLL